MIEDGHVRMAIMRYEDSQRAVRLGDELIVGMYNGPGAMIDMDPETFDGWLAQVNEWWQIHRDDALRRKAQR
jgi:hypothetical protein